MALHKLLITNRRNKLLGHAAAGFTLFEVIIAVGLLSVLFTLVLPGIFRALQYQVVTTAREHIQFMYTEGQVRALTMGWDSVVEVKVEEDRMFSMGKTPTQSHLQQSYEFPLGISPAYLPNVLRFDSRGGIQGYEEMAFNYSSGQFAIAVTEGGVFTK